MLIPAYLLNLHMYNEDGAIVPAHLPQSQDIQHLPSVLKTFILWLMKKKVGDEDGERLLLHRLGPWLDPVVMLPYIREIFRVKFMSLEWTFASHARAMIEVRIMPMLQQLSLQVN